MSKPAAQGMKARLLAAAAKRKLTARVGWCAWCDQDGVREAVQILLDASISGEVSLSEKAMREIIADDPDFASYRFAGSNPFGRHLREHEPERYARFKAR